jgi:hypothetical protein
MIMIEINYATAVLKLLTSCASMVISTLSALLTGQFAFASAGVFCKGGSLTLGNFGSHFQVASCNGASLNSNGALGFNTAWRKTGSAQYKTKFHRKTTGMGSSYQFFGISKCAVFEPAMEIISLIFYDSGLGADLSDTLFTGAFPLCSC